MKYAILTISFFLLLQLEPLHAQKWAVFFTDKSNTGFTIDKPEEFLSARAIQRRQKFNIDISEEDLPVNHGYVEQLRAMGVDILATSKWLNCALVNPELQSSMTVIEQLDFVDKIAQITNEELESPLSKGFDKWDEITYEPLQNRRLSNGSEYGFGYDQINQINGVPVHNRGYTGGNILITILDAGFNNSDSLDVFKHIRERNGIVFTRDIVNPGGDVFRTKARHGTSVFSCIGSKITGEFIGTAPDANFALIRTEDDRTEFRIEEYNLAVGLELADSIGTDIVNISLGYSILGELNHVFEEMDGRKTVSSYAAYRAVEKGISVCVSAGNTGTVTEWPWIGSPADVPEVTTVGAVDIEGQIAPFSSIGPNAVGFPKPDISALGVGATVVLPDNEMGGASGTSFASPISCGMIACLIQAFPMIPPLQLKEMINATGSYAGDYQVNYGYGIPDFEKVFIDNAVISQSKSFDVRVYPNPVKDILYFDTIEQIHSVTLIDTVGQIVQRTPINNGESRIDVSNLATGVYFAVFQSNNGWITMKICVTR